MDGLGGKPLADDEIQQQPIVLGGMHVDGDQDAAIDSAEIEEPAEVPRDADEQIELLPLHLLRLGRVHIGHLPPA